MTHDKKEHSTIFVFPKEISAENESGGAPAQSPDGAACRRPALSEMPPLPVTYFATVAAFAKYSLMTSENVPESAPALAKAASAPKREASKWRKPKLTEHRRKEAIRRRDAGDETLAEIGRSYTSAAGRFRGWRSEMALAFLFSEAADKSAGAFFLSQLPPERPQH